ncbi:Acyl-CoA dehydrogenase [Lentzea albidocapillata subsp. violacea]|uniref:Acyl-CoA dehydrogenase n=1 Tax=Lentzea albidocapillata subsp. violacea TaxID=128104 RepID=A0A1G8R2B3_9PSEU|nr:acyl-CoA dehydrogenase family protein [Lentzea albidocapillata]SDJ10540.1 Acyl-CoA dehydrogenase [Lentzea albidocapillata subsp. violacea]
MPIATTGEQRALRDSVDAARGEWADLVKVGFFEVTREGGTVADLAVMLERAAENLVPGPLLPTALVSVLCPDFEGVAGFGFSSRHVVGAAEATHLLLKTDNWMLVPAGQVTVTPLEAVDHSRSLGSVVVGEPGEAVADPTDLAVTLMAAEASGVAAWCLNTAVEYAKQRQQFGRIIGSFQAVKHLCVEMLCRAEQASSVAWDAARSVGDDEHPLAAAVAGAVAFDAAVRNAKDCIQVLGGIGFTWEHDAHRYLRRALALQQLAGGVARWRRRVAELALAGARRSLAVQVESDPDVRAFAEEIAGLDPAVQRERLASSGFLVPHWPKPYGQDAGQARQLVIDSEFARAGVRRPDLIIGGWAGPTILRHGTAEQQERFVPPTLSGELTWCQLFSEPEAGSDLASLRTKALQVDGGWKLTGQKVWTSLAHQADWAICLARTDSSVPKHKGITYFLVDMRSAGVDVRPLREITGDARFNEVFLDDVFVPDDCVVGAVNDGWRLARTTLANERVAMGSSLGEPLENVLKSPAAPDHAERLGALVAQGLAVSVLDLRASLRVLSGQEPGAESSVRKLVGVRQRQDVAEFAVELLGPDGATDNELMYEFLLSRCLSIAGGTTQVLMNLAGERILGLPREL